MNGTPEELAKKADRLYEALIALRWDTVSAKDIVVAAIRAGKI